MKKLRYIFFTVIFVTLATTLFLFLTNKGTKNINYPEKKETPSSTKTNPPAQTNKISIKTSEGSVEINNVEKKAERSVQYGNEIEYVLRDDTNGYSISYFPQNQGFIVAISRSEIQEARETAEKDFLNILGIDKEKACLLNVDLGAIYSANEEASGKNYGLSFCPNGKPFPGN